MAVQPALITDFTAGELSEKLAGRIDLDIYRKGAQSLINWVPFRQGGVITRPALKYLGTTKSGAKARLVPFAVNADNPFVLEFTNNLLRIWKAGALVGSPTETVTTYTTAQLFQIQFHQIGSVMYLVHYEHVIATITWDGGTGFTLAAQSITVADTLDAWQAATAYVVGDVVTNGTPLKAYTCITAGTSAGSGGPTTESDDITDNTAHWAWEWTKPFSQVGDYPSAIGFMNGRMVYGGTVNKPQDTWLSDPYAYGAFVHMTQEQYTYRVLKDHADWSVPTEPETELVTSKYVYTGEGHAITFTIASDREDDIYWYLGADTLIIGTSRAEWITNQDIDAHDVRALQIARFSSAFIQPIKFQDTPVFVEGNTSKGRLREFAYKAESAELASEDLTFHADHMLEDGVDQIDFCTNPQPTVFCVTDGEIAALLYDKKYGARAWYHIDTDGGTIESIAVVPGTTDDDIYVSVNRANGRTVELMEKLWDLDTTPLDSYVEIASIAGATQSGLERFNGENVTIWNVTDSAVHEDVAVSGGSLTYPAACGVGDNVIIGKTITCTGQTMRLPTRMDLGSAQGRRERVVAATARVLNSLPFKVGFWSTAATLQTAVRSDEVAWTTAYTGDVTIPFQGTWSNDAWVYFIQDQPYRSTILTLIPEIAT